MTGRMTKREALRILVHRALRDAAGVGCGVERPHLCKDVSDEKLGEAIRRVWGDIYRYEPSESDAFNMMMPFSVRKTFLVRGVKAT